MSPLIATAPTSLVMPTSLSGVVGDWLTATSTRSTARPGCRKSPVCVAWRWMLRNATLLKVTLFPLMAGSCTAICET